MFIFRFTIDPRRQKGRPNMIAGLHLFHALPAADIARLTGSGVASVEKAVGGFLHIFG